MTNSTGYLSGATVGRYRIAALLGRGGMGEVYRAEDTELRRAVALKVLPEALVGDPDRLSRFVQEARTASALNHPHLVAIYDIGEAVPAGAGAGATRPVHFIAMELVEGETLRQQIDRPQRDLKRMLEYCLQAADALAAAHGAGIVHRDFKPENLMVATGGYVKVLDFGLAKLRAEPALLRAAAQESTLATGTTPGVVMGTVGYMSPEQAQGRPVDHRSDIFAFGCVLYEAVTGTRAFCGSSAVDTLHQIINAYPPPLTSKLPNAPAELQRIVAKCLAKDPEERYQSMKEVAIDLRSLRRQLDSGSAATAVAPLSTDAKAGLSLGVLAAESGQPVKVFPNFPAASGGGSIAWTPDGTELLYTTVERLNVWRRKIADGEPERVTNFSDLFIVRFALSPDGRSLLLCRGTQVRDAFLITGFR